MPLTKTDMRVFWVYFWTKGKKSGEVKWVVKWNGKKHIVDTVYISVPTHTRGRESNPHGILFGKAKQCLVVQARFSGKIEAFIS